MNIVFWLGVLIVAFLLWYYLSKHFFKIGSDFKNMIDNIKEEINGEDKEQDEHENE